MTLPFAVTPEDSDIYQDLKGVQLADLTADQFDQLRSRIFAEGVNGTEDEYRRLLLLGQASQKISSSGPIAGTSQVIETDYGSSYTPDDGAYYNVLTPAKGEVYELGGMFVYSATGLTGYDVALKDTVNNTRIIIADGGSGDVFDNGFSPFYFDENTILQVNPKGTLSSDAAINTYVIRAR